MVRIRDPIHVADAAVEEGYFEQTNPGLRVAVELGGIRTFLAVPMVKDNELIGAFVLNRQQVRPFTDRQIELVKNFAAQAVIAIENARLLNELRQRTADLAKSLEQQTATSEVLQIISSSPGELDLVFETMLANAAHICEAKYGFLWVSEGDGLRPVAYHGVRPEFVAAYPRDLVLRPGQARRLQPTSSADAQVRRRSFQDQHRSSAAARRRRCRCQQMPGRIAPSQSSPATLQSAAPW